jgi:hypothetical protein
MCFVRNFACAKLQEAFHILICYLPRAQILRLAGQLRLIREGPQFGCTSLASRAGSFWRLRLPPLLRFHLRGRSSNGRAADSRSDGCVFESRRPHSIFLFFASFPSFCSFLVPLLDQTHHEVWLTIRASKFCLLPTQ